MNARWQVTRAARRFREAQLGSGVPIGGVRGDVPG